jgi:serine/threonine protein kinase/septal ring factor EnvC (AmiA/AmiB activator)
MNRQAPEILAGRYSLKAPHQEGGMASVYQARDLIIDELVAVKRFDGTKHLPEIEAEAYRREVEALQNLRHPNILKILDHGKDDHERPFLVLAWMKHDLVEHRRLGASAFDGWDDFADHILLPIIDALAHAHAKGYCHRDVKPANVLIGEDGTPHLADFGISKLKRCLHPRVTLNEFMSRPYSPPEPDDGAYSYARDVFSLGVLSVWALADTALHSYDDVDRALASIDVIPEVREILTRSLSKVPRERQSTASVLQLELSRIHERRRQIWIAKDRKRCVIFLTKRALTALQIDLDISNDSTVTRFVIEDINDEATIDRYVENRGTANEKVRPGQYTILGGTFSYHVAISEDQAKFVIINVRRYTPDLMQKLKSDQMQSPFTFALTPERGSVSAGEAAKTIELSLTEFEDARKRERESTAQDQLFLTWQNVLEAKSTFEREKVAPVRFSRSSVKGRLLSLELESSEITGVEIDQPRVIKTEGRWISGVVYSFNERELVLYCHQTELTEAPRSGLALLDTRGAENNIERQRTALLEVMRGGGARAELRDFLVAPKSTRPPNIGIELEGRVLDELDASQADSLRAALGSDDLLLVHGPPGTGKTAFIAHLINETLRRKPLARILLTSQTHVAIDNAIERVAKLNPTLPILRIARTDSDRVADSCVGYRVERQLDRWRREVAAGSEHWLRRWAESQGLNADEIVLGSLLKQIAAVRDNIERCRADIKEQDAELQQLREVPEDQRGTGTLVDIESLEAGIQELRIHLDEGKQHLEQLERRLKQSHADAKDYLAMDSSELSEWSALLLGKSDESRRAEQLLRLQADWIDRFGRDESFHGALCERSSVVAATCIGLASLAGADDVEYDLCIVDEASKATATEALVPMIRARRWVLVGDSRQLPPFEDEIHRSPRLRDRFDIDTNQAKETLFELLRRELPPECQRMLKRQYRMVPPIGRLISQCFYDGEVESAKRPLDPQLTSALGRAVTWFSTS